MELMELDRFKPLVLAAGPIGGTVSTAGRGYFSSTVVEGKGAYRFKVESREPPGGYGFLVARLETNGAMQADSHEPGMAEFLPYPGRELGVEHFKTYIQAINVIRAILNQREYECNEAMQRLAGSWFDNLGNAGL